MKLYTLLLFLLVGCAAETQTGTLVLGPGDSRVPRFCYIKHDQNLVCRRQMDLCREAEFEDRYVNRVRIRKSCMSFMIERSLLPYEDRY